MPLATSADVEKRLQRELSDAEVDAVQQAIETVTGLIADAVDQTVEWVEARDPVSPVLRALCVERAIIGLNNPTGISSESETLGTHSHSQTHRKPSEGGGLELTATEERMVSRAVYGTTGSTGSVDSPVNRLLNLREGREADEDGES